VTALLLRLRDFLGDLRLGVRMSLLLNFPRQYSWIRHMTVGRGHVPLAIRIAGYPHPLYVRPGTSDARVLRQIFRDEEYACVVGLPDVSFIVDCGANIGATAVYLLSRYPRATLVAIEPDPDNYEVCLRNLQAFGDRARVVNAAVWSQPGKVQVVRGEYRDGGYWATQVRSGVAQDQTLSVNAITLSQVLDDFGRPGIDLLKVDVETAETEIFSGPDLSWLARTRHLVIELHDERCEQAVLGAMDAYDFASSRSGELSVFLSLSPREPGENGNAKV
jgi:FkbM family methyltransferase